MGLFGDLFDFNGDGRLDTLEQATEFTAFMNLLDSEEEENNEDTTKGDKDNKGDNEHTNIELPIIAID